MARSMREDLGFSRADINSLANTLNGAGIEGQQRALLVAVFSAASEHVSAHVAPNGAAVEADPVPPPAAESLHDQILSAFIPAADDTVNDFCIQAQMRISPLTTT